MSRHLRTVRVFADLSYFEKPPLQWVRVPEDYQWETIRTAGRGEIEKGRRSGQRKPAADVLDRLERKYTKMAKDRAK